VAGTDTGDMQLRPTHLFTLRLWREPLDGGEVEWRAEVRHVATGERVYFRDWGALTGYLRAFVSEGPPSG
jgi:hypothetical protein